MVNDKPLHTQKKHLTQKPKLSANVEVYPNLTFSLTTLLLLSSKPGHSDPSDREIPASQVRFQVKRRVAPSSEYWKQRTGIGACFVIDSRLRILVI